MNTQQKPPLSWSVSAASDQGRRSENQDRMTRFPSPFGEVVAVADGMGGMNGGATAAETVVRMLPELLNQMPPSTPPADALKMGVRRINEEVYRLGHGGDPALANMGTTIVVALLRESGETLIASVGDSRAYLFRNHALRQLTKDHSAVQSLVDIGAISPEEARNHPESSVLTRAIGQQPDVQLELYPPFLLQPGDGLLICSDGLSGFTSPEAIANILRQNADPAAARKALGSLALEAGSDDNITIQYLRVNSAAAAAAPPLRRPRNWQLWAALAASLLIATAGVRYAIRQVPIPTLEIRINNGTGETAPTPTEAAPQKVQKPKPNEVKSNETKPTPVQTPKAVAVVFVSGERPEWLNRENKLDCVEMRQRERKDRKGRFHDADPTQTHVFYRAQAAGAKDCLLKHIPELKSAHVAEMPKLPRDIDIVILLPETETADL